MQVSDAPPLVKNTAVCPTSAQFMIVGTSVGPNPAPAMLCLITSAGHLPLMSRILR